jgi:hypothetical protein
MWKGIYKKDVKISHKKSTTKSFLFDCDYDDAYSKYGIVDDLNYILICITIRQLHYQNLMLINIAYY